jgi:hypothetical protein
MLTTSNAPLDNVSIFSHGLNGLNGWGAFKGHSFAPHPFNPFNPWLKVSFVPLCLSVFVRKYRGMRNSQNRQTLLVWTITSLLSMPGALAAQSQTTNGIIEGTVRSEIGPPLPGVAVILKNRDNGAERRVQTNSQGRYRALLLPLGAYEVEARSAGFGAMRRSGLNLGMAQTLDVSFRLKQLPNGEAAEVVTSPGVLEADRKFPGTSLNRRFVENLPLAGRKFLDLGVLVPGGTEAGERDTSATAVFSGVNHFYTNFTVDGADAFQAWSNLPRGKFLVPNEFSQHAIREFQVLNSNFPAEFGRSAGGLMSAVTKSGTNEWHGDGSYYLSHSALNATPRFAFSKPDTRQHQFGGSIGGPLVRDRLFIFTNYDRQDRNEPVIVTPGTVLDGFDATLATITMQAERQRFVEAGDFVRSLLGDFDRDIDNQTFLTRIDWQPGGRHTFAARFNLQDFDATNVPENGFAVPIASGMAVSNLGRVAVRNHSTVVQWNSVITPEIVNEARIQFALGTERETANAEGPQVRIGSNRTGVTFGRRQNFPMSLRERRWQWTDNLDIVRGRHDIKSGVDIHHIKDRSVSLPSLGGAYQFNSLRDFANGRYMAYTQAFGTAEDTLVSPHYGFFIQDNFRISSSLNANIGVRYEFQDLMSPAVTNPLFPQTGQIPSDRNNVAPRFGFAWSPGDQRQVVRGTYGIYHAPLPLLVNSFARMQNGISQYVQEYRRGAAAAPEYPAILPPQPPSAGIDIVAFSPDFANPYVQHANLEIERDVYEDLSLSVGWLFTKGTRLRRNDDLNLNPPVTKTIQIRDSANNFSGPLAIRSFGGPASRPIPFFDQITEYKSDRSSVFHALVVQAQKRYSHGVQFLFNYTLSKLIDSGEAPGAQTTCCTSENPFDPGDERGLGRRDQRHRVNAALVWDVYGGWRLSGIVRAGSGRPLTPTVTGDSGGDVNGDGVRGDRAPLFGRSAFVGPGYASTDFSVEKTFIAKERTRVGFVFEAFNVFNRANYLRPAAEYFNLMNQADGSVLLDGPLPTFGAPFDATRSREVQVALKVSF